MSANRVVIAGAGQAGFQVTASLRQDGFQGEIVLIGEEAALPYQRPPLSKAFIKDGNAERLAFRPAEFFTANRIELETGRAVVDIDRRGRRVTLDDGRRIGFDHLVIATGARNRRLPVDGAALDGVLDLRALVDAQRLRAALAEADRLAVIGGGFIGLEIAATAASLGKQVTVLEATHRLMSRVVSAPVSDFFLDAHRGYGVEVRLNAFAKRILDAGAGRAGAVELDSGERIEADLVLVAAGVVANAELAEEAGLYVHDGVRVDDLLLTEDPAISAVGDCASFPFGHDGVQTRLESVQNAVDQAKCVARRLTGYPEPYRKPPWFWSDQGPHKLQIAGLTVGADEHVVRHGEDGKLSVHCFRRGELIGVETVDAPGDHMAARRLLARATPPARAELEAAGFDLAALARR